MVTLLFDPHITGSINFHFTKEGEFLSKFLLMESYWMVWYKIRLKTDMRCTRKADEHVNLECRVLDHLISHPNTGLNLEAWVRLEQQYIVSIPNLSARRPNQYNTTIINHIGMDTCVGLSYEIIAWRKRVLFPCFYLHLMNQNLRSIQSITLNKW